MTKPLSPTQAQIFSSAAQHPVGRAEAPPTLPIVAHNAVFGSLLRAGLLEEVPSRDGAAAVVRITRAWLAAVSGTGSGELAGEAAVGAQESGGAGETTLGAPELREALVGPSASARSGSALRTAATALLAAWDAGEGRPDLPEAVEALRAALSRAGATRSARNPSAPRRPREGTKQQVVLTLLLRPKGATITQVMEATGWAQHTVRGFLAGLKKKGHTVAVLERVRQVRSEAQGAKGSYSVYRIAAGEQG